MEFPVTLGKEKWSQRQLKAYEVQQRQKLSWKKKKRKYVPDGTTKQEKNQKRRIKTKEKLKKQRMLQTYDRRVQGLDRFGDEEDEVAVNKLWVDFYKAQKLTRSPAEFKEFIRAMSTPLPVTFRVEDICPVYLGAKTRMDSDEFQFKGSFIEASGRVLKTIVEPLRIVQNSWKINADRSGLQRTESLRPLYKFVTREMRLGHISRQEEASMVPVHVLERIMATEKAAAKAPMILDMCCCPGSKSRQMLSVLRSSLKGKGCLVANDSDAKRIVNMVKQMERMGSENLLVTCERGEDLLGKIGPGVFDYAYADVPCTGDGTFRKAPALWPKWHPANGLAMHRLQLQIALHGYSLVKPGGVFVYSTCSLNPLENEAVVATIIEETSFGCDLLSVKDLLQNSVLTEDGVTDWVLDGKEWGDEKSHHSILPPSQRGLSSKRRARLDKRLRKTARLMPHKSGTGGFYIAVFRKTKPWSMGAASAAGESGASSACQELDEASALNLLKNRMGFKATSSSEAKSGICLYPVDGKELKMLRRKFDFASVGTEEGRALVTTNPQSRRENFEEDDKPFNMVSQAANKLLGTLLSSEVAVIHAGVSVLTRQAPNDYDHGDSTSAFYEASEYCLVPDGICPFLPEINARKMLVSLRDFALLIHLQLNDSGSSGLSAKTLGGTLSSNLFELLLSVSPGSSIAVYLDPELFVKKEIAGDAVLASSAGNSTGGKKRVRRRKVKRGSVAKNAGSSGSNVPETLHEVKKGPYQPMGIVLFSLGESFHVLTQQDRLESYQDYITSCLENPFAGDEEDDSEDESSQEDGD